MKCPNCGKEIANDSQFCEFCGTQLKQSTKNTKALWIILAVLLCSVVIGVLVYSEHNAQQAAIAEANQRAEEARIEADKKAKKCALIMQGYEDLGLPSGTLWKGENEEGILIHEQAIYKYNKLLPSGEQFKELLDLCSWSLKNGGYQITGPNGNSIFLPAEGVRSCDYEDGSPGFTWGQGSRGSYACQEDLLLLEWETGKDGMPSFLPCIGESSNCVGVSIRLVQKP